MPKSRPTPPARPPPKSARVEITAGAGPTPIGVSGHAYLAGPYRGAPLCLAIITPAIAGPFDLGNVVVRAALYVNPETAQITAKSDPIPSILDGIPLDVRSVTLKLSRPELHPQPDQLRRIVLHRRRHSRFSGRSAPLTQRFQVGGCPALPFAPRLAFASGRHQAYRQPRPSPRSSPPNPAKPTSPPPGHPSPLRVPRTTPTSRAPAPKPVFAEGSAPGEKCPSASIYGFAKAETPLLEKPLEGPVYLRSAPGHHSPTSSPP